MPALEITHLSLPGVAACGPPRVPESLYAEITEAAEILARAASGR